MMQLRNTDYTLLNGFFASFGTSQAVFVAPGGFLNFKISFQAHETFLNICVGKS
jgi:hypothetical protein